MPFVLDASIAHDWAFEEGHPSARAARERLETDRALTPSLWWFEFRNGLVTAERRGRASEEQTSRVLREISRFPITLDYSPDEGAVMTLARRHRLTVYDASYLELALREGVPLATLDGLLADAARTEHVELLGG